MAGAPASSSPASPASEAEIDVKAMVPGVILRLNVSVGATVSKGDELIIMDVMKMETPVTAPCDGTVRIINVSPSDKVNTGDVLVVISGTNAAVPPRPVPAAAPAVVPAPIPAAAPAPAQTAAAGGGTDVKAMVPGVILRICAAVGTAVSEGDEVLVMDVMKMETPVTAPCNGTVKIINVSPSDKVNTGDVLAVIQ